jgi:hypothetical protein
MDKKTKIFFLVLGLLIIYSIAATYYRTFIAKDYIIIAEIGCKPSIENCLVYTCDPEIDGECPEDEAEWASYYKIIKKKLANIPSEIDSCDPHLEECPEPSCDPGEPDCQIIECDPENLGEDEECITPEEYNLENPEEDEECSEDDEDCILEESEECLEGDEECILEDSTDQEAGEATSDEEGAEETVEE